MVLSDNAQEDQIQEQTVEVDNEEQQPKVTVEHAGTIVLTNGQQYDTPLTNLVL